ncbi:MAG: PBECR4 domain-containing protein [Blautia massiliensis (ex Durand et al. 2017)]
MGKQQDREKIVQEIKIAADLYRKHLVGKRFLYVFEGRYIEVLYKAANLRHLTGVATNLSAKSFIVMQQKSCFRASRYFTPQHPFSLCKRKIKHIGQIAMLAGSEGFMLEEIVTDTRTYKFGTTDLNFTLCLNKEYDDQGQQKGDCFVVESLRDEDCFSKSRTAYTVTHIFSAPNDAKKYTTLLFLDENAMIDSLPDEIKNMLDQTLLHK